VVGGGVDGPSARMHREGGEEPHNHHLGAYGAMLLSYIVLSRVRKFEVKGDMTVVQTVRGSK
jgi:hypothetical protein